MPPYANPLNNMMSAAHKPLSRMCERMHRVLDIGKNKSLSVFGHTCAKEVRRIEKTPTIKGGKTGAKKSIA